MNMDSRYGFAKRYVRHGFDIARTCAVLASFRKAQDLRFKLKNFAKKSQEIFTELHESMRS